MKPVIRCSFCNRSTHSKKEVFMPNLFGVVSCCNNCYERMLKPKNKGMRWF